MPRSKTRWAFIYSTLARIAVHRTTYYPRIAHSDGTLVNNLGYSGLHHRSSPQLKIHTRSLNLPTQRPVAVGLLRQVSNPYEDITKNAYKNHRGYPSNSPCPRCRDRQSLQSSEGETLNTPLSEDYTPGTMRSSSLRTWETATAARVPRPGKIASWCSWIHCRCYLGSRYH